MTEGALSGLRVIDLTHYIAGPYCTKLMAGFGAEVIKVELPGRGDMTRSMGPFYKAEAGIERSIPFLWLNTGKKSITLNIKSSKGREILKDIIREADVLVENFSPSFLPSLNLDYETLRELNPRLVMTSISNFGQTGPYRNYEAEEIVEYALSGGMYLTGDPAKAPLNAGPAVTQYTAGLNAYVGTLMALFRRGNNGMGAHVDVSIQESALDNIEISLVNYLHLGVLAKRTNDRHSMVPWELYPCSDGEVAVISAPIRYWHRAAEVLDEPALFDKKYRHCMDRRKYREEYEALLKKCLKKYRKKELSRAGQEKKLAFGYLADFDDVLESPQLRSRKFFEEVTHPVTGSHRYCGAPYKMSKTPWRHARAPLLGEHNFTVYGKMLGLSMEELEQLKKEGVI